MVKSLRKPELIEIFLECNRWNKEKIKKTQWNEMKTLQTGSPVDVEI